MKSLLMMGLLLGMCASLLAQTEASMCVSVTNTGDSGSHWDSTDYFIPSGEQISQTFFLYNSPSTDGVRVDCYQVNGDGSTGTRIWTVNNTFCACGSSSTTVGHPIAGNQTIRLRVYRTDCPGYSISSGTSKVYFYTSATAASCPPQCQQN